MSRQSPRYDIGGARRAQGDENRERVRQWFREHLCGTNRECAEAVGLSEFAVGRHVRAIRSEWRRKQ